MERISGLVHPDGLFHRPNPLKDKIKTKNLFDRLWQRPRGKEYSPRGHIVWQEYGLSGFSPPIEAFEDRGPLRIHAGADLSSLGPAWAYGLFPQKERCSRGRSRTWLSWM